MSGEMTNEGMRVLRTIHERGLIVLHSYRVPHPRYGTGYDDGEPMPSEDWGIASRELWQVETEHGSIVRDEYHWIERDVIRAGGIAKERVRVMPDGSERIYPPMEWQSGGFPSKAEGHVLGQREWTEFDTQSYERRVWKSDYLRQEPIQMDEWFEYEIGLLSRYVLTDMALALLNAAAT